MAHVPSRVIAILRLFTQERPTWSAEEMAQAIGVSPSTAYRYIAELAGSGFLDPAGWGSYALGPAFIQYDQLMRKNDKLITISAPLMRNIIHSLDTRIDVVLSRLFKNGVLCIHQENGSSPHPLPAYERGVAMPIFRGATSKVILANLPDRGLKRLYLENENAIRTGHTDTDWKSFKAELRKIKKAGYSITQSEVTAGKTGIAAPIFRENEVIASLSVIMEQTTFRELAEQVDIPSVVTACTRQICAVLAQETGHA